MHPHHKLALDNARGAFSRAKRDMALALRHYNKAREFYVVKGLDDHYYLTVVRCYLKTAIRAIEEYRAAGEILVAVERMLRNA